MDLNKFGTELIAGLAENTAALNRVADSNEAVAEAINGQGGAVTQTTTVATEKPAEKTTTKPAATKATEKPADKPAEAPKPEHDLEAVRTVLKEYRAIEGSPAMLELIATHGGGVSDLASLKPEFYDSVFAAATAG